MKDFKDFVKTTYAGLMEVEGLNESTSHSTEIEKHFGKIKSHENSHYYSAGNVWPVSHVYHTESGHDIEHISPKHNGNGKHYVEVTKGDDTGFAEHRNFAQAVKRAKDNMISQTGVISRAR